MPTAVEFLQAKGLKYAAAGESLGSQILFANQELTITTEETMIEDFSMQNPASPKERYGVGKITIITGVLQSYDLEELETILGGAVDAAVYTENATQVRTIPKQDIEIEAFNFSGAVKPIALTNVHFIPKFDKKFSADNKHYLPFEIRTTSSSVKTITLT